MINPSRTRAAAAHVAAVAALLPTVDTTPRALGRSLPDVPPGSLRAALMVLVQRGTAQFEGEMGKRLYSRREITS